MAMRMQSSKLFRRLLGLAGWIGIVSSAWAAFPQRAAAQDDRPSLLVSSNPQEPAAAQEKATGRIEKPFLRPNVEQSFYIYVENPSANAVNVVVQMVAGNRPDTWNAPVTVKAGERQRVKLGIGAPPAPAPAPAPATPAPAGATPVSAPGVDLGSPPFTIQFRLLDADGKRELARIPVRGILMPHEYTNATATYDAANKKLTVKVTRPEPVVGRDLDVQLVLPIGRIPGLKGADEIKDAALVGTLGADNPEVTLFARDFRAGAPETGFFYVTVDGYERAFIFTTDFTGADPVRFQSRALRLVAPPLSQPITDFTVRAEADNWQGPDDLSVVMGIFQQDGSALEQLRLKKLPPGYRDQHIRLDPAGKDDAVVFSTSVQDWKWQYDAQGLLGKRVFQAWMLQNGQKVELRNSPDENEQPVTMVRTDVTFDKSPPQITDLKTVPQTAVRGGQLQLRASGDDPESGIKMVRFFLGRVTDDNKVPPGAKPIKAVLANGEWTQTVSVPNEVESPMPITVQFVNNLGMESVKDLDVPVAAKMDSSASGSGAAPAGPKTGKITGSVLLGHLPQAERDVVLKDAKGTEKTRKKTDADGNFVFADLEPGEYQVSCSKEESGGFAKGKKTVTVEAGKTAKANLDLLRTP